MARLKRKPVIWISKSGEPITEADALAMAEAFEKDDSDPATWERRYVGRPSLSPLPAGVHSPRVSVRLPKESFQLLQARAAREDRRVSDVAREAIEAYIRT